MNIGIFDSGIGGLSVANSIFMRCRPSHLSYIADNKFIPYGSQDKDIIRERVSSILSYFATVIQPNLVICACNTAFTMASDLFFDHSYPFELLNVTERFLLKHPPKVGGKTLLIATKNTISSEVYQKSLLSNGLSSHNLLVHSDHLLVKLIEQGLEKNLDHILTCLRDIKEKYKHEKLDTVILGCTHYNWISKHFRQLFPNAHTIESAELFDDICTHYSSESSEYHCAIYYTGHNCNELANRNDMPAEFYHLSI